MLRQRIPDEKRGEVHHLATRSIQLSGFTLSFLALLSGFYRNSTDLIFEPSSLLLFSFALFLAVSQFTWNAKKQWHFFLAEAVHKIGTIILLAGSFWVFFVIFNRFLCFLLVAGMVFTIYVLYDLLSLYRDIAHLW